jgi:hypothetical protein
MPYHSLVYSTLAGSQATHLLGILEYLFNVLLRAFVFDFPRPFLVTTKRTVPYCGR